jgi:hypothetical protein
MEQQIAILNWLQNNPEVLNQWYSTDITSEDVVSLYTDGKKYRYYLIGDDAVKTYNEGYVDKNDREFECVLAVVAADEDNIITYDIFKEEINETTIKDFADAADGQDWISITKEEYQQL